MTTNYKDICEMFNDSKAYAMEKNINKIILFAKGIENVLKFKNILDETDIELIITTFPSNQVLYIEDEEEGIIETHPEILSFENRTKLKSLNIPQHKISEFVFFVYESSDVYDKVKKHQYVEAERIFEEYSLVYLDRLKTQNITE